MGTVLWVGCFQGRPEAVSEVSVDPQAAASDALTSYDANGDSALDETELETCPALAAAMDGCDVDGNGRLAREEIADHLTRMFTGGVGLMNATCTVTFDGQPLGEAEVVLQPADFLGKAIQQARGVTGETGRAHLKVADEHLPGDLAGSRVMQPGLYRVEITHPEREIPSRYNTDSELGMAVDPSSRDGQAATFRLRSR